MFTTKEGILGPYIRRLSKLNEEKPLTETELLHGRAVIKPLKNKAGENQRITSPIQKNEATQIRDIQKELEGMTLQAKEALVARALISHFKPKKRKLQ